MHCAFTISWFKCISRAKLLKLSSLAAKYIWAREVKIKKYFCGFWLANFAWFICDLFLVSKMIYAFIKLFNRSRISQQFTEWKRSYLIIIIKNKLLNLRKFALLTSLKRWEKRKMKANSLEWLTICPLPALFLID